MQRLRRSRREPSYIWGAAGSVLVRETVAPGTRALGLTSESTRGSGSSDRRIWRRWERWAPLCGGMPEARLVHRAAMQALLRAGVPMERIKRLDADDPRISAEDRAELIRGLVAERGEKEAENAATA